MRQEYLVVTCIIILVIQSNPLLDYGYYGKVTCGSQGICYGRQAVTDRQAVTNRQAVTDLAGLERQAVTGLAGLDSVRRILAVTDLPEVYSSITGSDNIIQQVIKTGVEAGML